MHTLNQFKANYSFTEVVSRFGYHFSTNKNNICPCCGKITFSVYNNDTKYKCFRPNCILNKPGDIFNFLENMGISEGFKNSLNLLEINTSNSSNKPNTSILDKVFTLYKKCFYDSSEAQNYLSNRGCNINKIEVGYAPSNPYFLRDNLPTNLNELRRYHLIKDNEKDYFNNRLIFTIRDLNNKLVHFHGRDISNKSTLRWMGSKKREDRNIDYLWRGHIEKKSPALFLTEGISDAISLVNWDIPTVATMSIQADFIKLFQPFTDLDELHCIFDNDRQSINNSKFSDTYKSWEHVLPKLIDLKLTNPKLKIYCMMPPTYNGIKDLNDWISNLSKKQFQDYYIKHSLDLGEFTFNLYKDRLEYGNKLILLSQYYPKLKQLMSEYISNCYDHWIDYAILLQSNV